MLFAMSRKLILRNAYFDGIRTSTRANESELRLVKFHYNLPERLPVQESEFMDSGSRGAPPRCPRCHGDDSRRRGLDLARGQKSPKAASFHQIKRCAGYGQRRRALFSLGKASLRAPASTPLLGAYQRVRQSDRIPLTTACRLSTYCACTVALLRC